MTDLPITSTDALAREFWKQTEYCYSQGWTIFIWKEGDFVQFESLEHFDLFEPNTPFTLTATQAKARIIELMSSDPDIAQLPTMDDIHLAHHAYNYWMPEEEQGQLSLHFYQEYPDRQEIYSNAELSSLYYDLDVTPNQSVIDLINELTQFPIVAKSLWHFNRFMKLPGIRSFDSRALCIDRLTLEHDSKTFHLNNDVDIKTLVITRNYILSNPLEFKLLPCLNTKNTKAIVIRPSIHITNIPEEFLDTLDDDTVIGGVLAKLNSGIYREFLGALETDALEGELLARLNSLEYADDIALMQSHRFNSEYLLKFSVLERLINGCPKASALKISYYNLNDTFKELSLRCPDEIKSQLSHITSLELTPIPEIVSEDLNGSNLTGRHEYCIPGEKPAPLERYDLESLDIYLKGIESLVIDNLTHHERADYQINLMSSNKRYHFNDDKEDKSIHLHTSSAAYNKKDLFGLQVIIPPKNLKLKKFVLMTNGIVEHNSIAKLLTNSADTLAELTMNQIVNTNTTSFDKLRELFISHPDSKARGMKLIPIQKLTLLTRSPRLTHLKLFLCEKYDMFQMGTIPAVNSQQLVHVKVQNEVEVLNHLDLHVDDLITSALKNANLAYFSVIGPVTKDLLPNGYTIAGQIPETNIGLTIELPPYLTEYKFKGLGLTDIFRRPIIHMCIPNAYHIIDIDNIVYAHPTRLRSAILYSTRLSDRYPSRRRPPYEKPNIVTTLNQLLRIRTLELRNINLLGFCDPTYHNQVQKLTIANCTTNKESLENLLDLYKNTLHYLALLNITLFDNILTIFDRKQYPSLRKVIIKSTYHTISKSQFKVIIQALDYCSIQLTVKLTEIQYHVLSCLGCDVDKCMTYLSPHDANPNKIDAYIAEAFNLSKLQDVYDFFESLNPIMVYQFKKAVQAIKDNYKRYHEKEMCRSVYKAGIGAEAIKKTTRTITTSAIKLKAANKSIITHNIKSGCVARNELNSQIVFDRIDGETPSWLHIFYRNSVFRDMDEHNGSLTFYTKKKPYKKATDIIVQVLDNPLEIIIPTKLDGHHQYIGTKTVELSANSYENLPSLSANETLQTLQANANISLWYSESENLYKIHSKTNQTATLCFILCIPESATTNPITNNIKNEERLIYKLRNLETPEHECSYSSLDAAFEAGHGECTERSALFLSKSRHIDGLRIVMSGVHSFIEFPTSNGTYQLLDLGGTKTTISETPQPKYITRNPPPSIKIIKLAKQQTSHNNKPKALRVNEFIEHAFDKRNPLKLCYWLKNTLWREAKFADPYDTLEALTLLLQLNAIHSRAVPIFIVKDPRELQFNNPRIHRLENNECDIDNSDNNPLKKFLDAHRGDFKIIIVELNKNFELKDQIACNTLLDDEMPFGQDQTRLIFIGDDTASHTYNGPDWQSRFKSNRQAGLLRIQATPSELKTTLTRFPNYQDITEHATDNVVQLYNNELAWESHLLGALSLGETIRFTPSKFIQAIQTSQSLPSLGNAPWHSIMLRHFLRTSTIERKLYAAKWDLDLTLTSPLTFNVTRGYPRLNQLAKKRLRIYDGFYHNAPNLHPSCLQLWLENLRIDNRIATSEDGLISLA